MHSLIFTNLKIGMLVKIKCKIGKLQLGHGNKE